MATLIRMPEIAANATSAVIKAWSLKEGDSVAVGATLAEIETDKALIEFTSDEQGVLGKILARAGVDIEVGAPIAVLYAAGEGAVDVDALLAAADGVNTEVALAEGVNTELAPAAPAALGAAPAVTARVFASPLARRLARDSGVDLGSLKGSGPRGRIVKRDLESAQQAAPVQQAAAPVQQPASVAAAAASGPVTGPATRGASAFTEVPHSSMRRTIARRLTESKATIPHFYLTADIRMDALMALRAQVNAAAPRKISVNDLIVKAVAAALRDMPDMNVSWTDSALRRYAQADIAVAVATESGLITPVLRAADSKPLSAISAEIADLAARARSGKLAPDEYQGGSFTISNLGMFGVRDFTAIINPPQAAILAVGATSARPLVVDGALVAASVMTVTLSVDHRAIDGALAAQWLALLQRNLENPLSILI
jgi:pyruvate dehydrogenase E2 component (dihydrolipoamide acetyltransferase)